MAPDSFSKVPVNMSVVLYLMVVFIFILPKGETDVVVAHSLWVKIRSSFGISSKYSDGFMVISFIIGKYQPARIDLSTYPYFQKIK